MVEERRAVGNESIKPWKSEVVFTGEGRSEGRTVVYCWPGIAYADGCMAKLLDGEDTSLRLDLKLGVSELIVIGLSLAAVVVVVAVEYVVVELLWCRTR